MMFCGLDWVEKPISINNTNGAKELSNSEVGIFYTSMNFHYQDFNEDDYYKILSLIKETNNKNSLLVFCIDEEYNHFKKWNNTYNIITDQNKLIESFPNNLTELKIRSLMNLYYQYPNYGSKIETVSNYDFYSKNDNELSFILSSLIDNKLIQTKIGHYIDDSMRIEIPIIITENGWNEIEKNFSKTRRKQVFIAMWFNESMEEAYIAIEKALLELGLSIIRIDKKQHNNEISGEILKEIKDSRFIIADVTGQRNGVYFEAGFAMGLNKPVIWTCKSTDLTNIHFDTRQYNHVIWSDIDDLYKKIKDRIMFTVLFD